MLPTSLNTEDSPPTPSDVSSNLPIQNLPLKADQASVSPVEPVSGISSSTSQEDQDEPNPYLASLKRRFFVQIPTQTSGEGPAISSFITAVKENPTLPPSNLYFPIMQTNDPLPLLQALSGRTTEEVDAVLNFSTNQKV